jgi:hypothetical protein
VAPVDVLRSDGFVRANRGVLDPEWSCDQCLKQIKEELEQSGHRQHHDSTKQANAWDGFVGGFDNMFSQDNRHDTCLRKEGACEQLLGCMLQRNSILACLFEALLEGKMACFTNLQPWSATPEQQANPCIWTANALNVHPCEPHLWPSKKAPSCCAAQISCHMLGFFAPSHLLVRFAVSMKTVLISLPIAIHTSSVPLLIPTHPLLPPSHIPCESLL